MGFKRSTVPSENLMHMIKAYKSLLTCFHRRFSLSTSTWYSKLLWGPKFKTFKNENRYILNNNNNNNNNRKLKWEGKQLYGRFKRLINNILHDKTWTWLRKGNFKRETESLQIAAQNSAIRTNHIKARVDKTQQNSKCRLCGERDETINHIISECSQLTQREYKARHDWVDKVIPWEMCKKFKFDHANKWYMHNPAPVLKNDTHKLLWDFVLSPVCWEADKYQLCLALFKYL